MENPPASVLRPAPPGAVAPCAACWIEIELLDEQDRGLAREPYRVELPDGRIREGRLDEDGFARLDRIPCGVCLVRFPRMDGPAVRLDASQEEGKDWLEIRLLDTDDEPVPEEPYRVELPDGSVRSGTLDRDGRARLDGLPPGSCVVTFPGLDAKEFVTP